MDLVLGAVAPIPGSRPTLRLDSTGYPGRRGGGKLTTNGAEPLDIGLLGPVRVLRGAVPVDIGGVRPQTLLAILALRAGSPVSLDVLTDELWAGEPPDGSPTTLRSYVSRLRTAMGASATIDRRSTGYVLDVPRDWVDVVRFESTVRAGRALLDGGRFRRAAAVLREALELWRGRPFDGLPADGSFRSETARLEELRLHALESRIEADLASGRAGDLVDELEGLLAEHPFREHLWRHLMLALYRAGRQADALAAYHRARAALDEQLGIQPGEELQTLEAAILRQDLPVAADRRPMLGVPAALTSFVGRSTEVAEIVELLRGKRLVTLVGLGGVGKTRLSIEAARRALDDIVDGIAFVDLAALSDPAHLSAQVAASLGLQESVAGDLGSALAEHVGSTAALLILDNCEHLREAAAELAQGLLATSPDLRILATSREILDVAGEAPYPVPPLDEDDAVRLLVDRATLTRHGLEIDEAAMATAARICRDLEALPLAIELAAARTKALSLDEIADRLGDRFQFLVSWRRLTSARHRTLREAMGWSYELLAPDEQRLLARLSVFPAGASLDSVAAVCLDGDDLEAGRLIERLIDASLVVPIDGELGTRLRLLETVRQYAAERLPEDELPALQRRHAERVLAIAESTNLGLEGASHASRFDVARTELPSIRAAIHWAGDTDPSLAVAIAAALERFWAFIQPRDSIAMLTALLADDSLSDAERARVLRCRGGCRYASGDFAGGVEDYESALEIHRRLDDRAHQAHLLMRIAVEAQRKRDGPEARRLLDEAAAIGGDERFASDRYVSLEIEADLAFDEGRLDDAFAMLERAGQLATEAGDTIWLLDSLQAIADRASDAGRFAVAEPAAREALILARKRDVRSSVIWGLAFLGRLAAEASLHERAGRIWGGLEAEVERGGPVGQWESEAEERRAHVASAGGAAFHAGVAEGLQLSLDAVIEEALAET